MQPPSQHTCEEGGKWMRLRIPFHLHHHSKDDQGCQMDTWVGDISLTNIWGPLDEICSSKSWIKHPLQGVPHTNPRGNVLNNIISTTKLRRRGRQKSVELPPKNGHFWFSAYHFSVVSQKKGGARIAVIRRISKKVERSPLLFWCYAPPEKNWTCNMEPTKDGWIVYMSSFFLACFWFQIP